MLKPALIIGLGGTGVMTLRHPKTQLLASKNRDIPQHIQLIAFDTVRDEMQSASKPEETGIAAFPAQLEPGEYFWIGGESYNLVREVAQGKHPHINSWFKARSYLDVR